MNIDDYSPNVHTDAVSDILTIGALVNIGARAIVKATQVNSLADSITEGENLSVNELEKILAMQVVPEITGANNVK